MSKSAIFQVNGRFLGQSVTGVQRYARSVVMALDEVLAQSGATAPILAPVGIADPKLRAMKLVNRGRLSGHLWEQLVLPWQCEGPLLNLCNTAPVAKAEQVVCIHDANVFVAPESYGANFRRFYQFVQPQLARRAFRIATVSQASARQIARYLPIRAADIAVLPNGHEHARAWDPALAETAPFMVGPDRRFVLALGSRARHKNLVLLAKIAPALADRAIDIVVAGGEGSIFSDETLAAAGNLQLLGRVSDDDLAWLMDRAICLVFPSWTEGFGLPIIEAMARGCPVISSDRASMPEVCGNAALMASPSDPAAWVDRIFTLADSADQREELIGRGHVQARLFSWAETAAGYLDLMNAHAGPIPARVLQNTRPSRGAEPNVAVVIATRGRPNVVSATVRYLIATQILKPAAIVVSCADASDAGDLQGLDGVLVAVGSPGLAAQRNTGIRALRPGIDVIVFFDDDFVADPRWLAAAARVFYDDPTVVGLTGHVLADGIKAAGIAFEDAVKIIETAPQDCEWSWIEPYSPYGCNMAFRASAIVGQSFDERLVLYGWLEDRDFAAKLQKAGGRLAKCSDLRGVHMGVKTGRVAGDRLGYSQIVNPVYMLGKKTMTAGQASGQMLRNVASNLLRAPIPEPFIDRRGRLRGNFMGLADILRGIVEPERAAEIGTTRKQP